ncbi:MAG: L,D-transpeptidase [Candidatus Margulisiibacteriota bacterium]
MAKQKHRFIQFIFLILLVVSGMLQFNRVVHLYVKRNIAYLMVQDRLEVYEQSYQQVLATSHSLHKLQRAPEPKHDEAYLVISLAERHLWYKQGGKILFSAPVATGSGKTLVRNGGQSVWKFQTPRGRLVVQNKVEDPMWVPPDWHYVEQSRLRGLGLVQLGYAQTRTLSDGSLVKVVGYDVVRQFPDGHQQVLSAAPRKEIVLDGSIIVPPLGTAQRRYKDVLGPYSLEMGDGYAIHGTNRPETIGQAASHGCIRLRNEDITRLFKLVKIGTPVYIY